MLPTINNHTIRDPYGISPVFIGLFDGDYLKPEDIDTISKRCFVRIHRLHQQLQVLYGIASKKNNMDTGVAIYGQLAVTSEVLRILLQEISLEEDPTRLQDLKYKEKNRLWEQPIRIAATVQQFVEWQNQRLV